MKSKQQILERLETILNEGKTKKWKLYWKDGSRVMEVEGKVLLKTLKEFDIHPSLLSKIEEIT